MEIAVIGNDLFTLGFKLAGVRKTLDATDARSFSSAVNAVLKDKEVGIVVMRTEDVRLLDAHQRRLLEESLRPTLVTIGSDEDTGLREKLKQAIGVDVWK
jgi:V/A-type H+/Na+-transporting ATPase subunit F